MTLKKKVSLTLASLGLAYVCACTGSDGLARPAGSGTNINNGDHQLNYSGHMNGVPWPSTDPVQLISNEHWKTEIQYRFDPYLSELQAENFSWVKFSMLVGQPDRIYYQDSNHYKFHYDFAVNTFDRFRGMSHSEFDAISLHAEGQQIVLGSVLFPSAYSGHSNEFAMQLAGADAYQPRQVAHIYQLVKNSVVGAHADTKLFYFPSFEQEPSTVQWSDVYEQLGVHVGSVERWTHSDICYSKTWGLGRLKFVRGEAIDQAYQAGELRPDDILLTDGVPAEVPYVAGIVTLTPSTPNSHVAILAETFDVPFVYVVDEDKRVAIRALEGKDVAVMTGESCNVSVMDITGLDPERRAELLARKQPAPLQYAAKQSAGAVSQNTAVLSPDDVKHFGGKAANFGTLKRSIPDNSPEPAIALSFDLWDRFMSQTLSTGQTLRQEIGDRLAGFAYVPDMGALEDALADVRKLIKKRAAFSQADRDAIVAALGVFDPNKKIRFRSSTNVEDGTTFSGAGLYDSYSGCLADDLDGDDQGPSLCDPSKSKERGVFRAIRKVYASFYNMNAFLSRLLYRVAEEEVGMAVLVHHSFPDEIELANGVITLEWNYGHKATIVSQPGATSVTNPEGGARPEVVIGTYNESSQKMDVMLQQPSDLLPNGRWVLETPEVYARLGSLVLNVFDQWVNDHPEQSRPALDMEYKLVVPGKLVIKQVRYFPKSQPSQDAPILLNRATSLCNYQGEWVDILAMHRAKIRMEVEPDSVRLDMGEGQKSFLNNVTVQYVDDGSVVTLKGDPSSWPGAQFSATTEFIEDSWTVGQAASERRFMLRTSLAHAQRRDRPPVVTLEDLRTDIVVSYGAPQPTAFGGSTRRDSTELGSCHDVLPQGSTLVNEDWNLDGGVTIHMSYYIPPHPEGPTQGYAFPVIKWKETRIEGLTPEPIVLHDFFSQTYSTTRHNFENYFAFEPRLEPGMSQEQLQVLADIDIVTIVLMDEGEFGGGRKALVLGKDGTLRPWQAP